MKISFVCVKCTENFEIGGPVDFLNVQVNNDCIYSVKCPNGHSQIIIDQQERFELLFESAINAINDGYYREAVSSIAASLERFYEFSIKVICFENKVSKEQYVNIWKSVVSQSERQYGVFIFLYTLHFKEVCNILSNEKTKFRNKVIHKGYFPSKMETVGYAQDCLNIIHDIILKLRENCTNSINEIMRERMGELGEKATEISKLPIITISYSTIISLTTTPGKVNSIQVVDYLK